MENYFKCSLVLFFTGFLLSKGIANNIESVGYDFSDQSKTVQFDVKTLLNARAVTTISNGRLITWNKGIDGIYSGLATRVAADSMGSKGVLALPDNGIFAANKFHPLVVLNFSNNDATGSQVRYSDAKLPDSFSFNVPENSYSNISLFLMSAFGKSEISVDILYSDKSTENKKYTIDDWAANIPETETKYILAANMAKWSDKNVELEKDSHFLMGINIMPNKGKKVIKITVNKPASGTTLVFWGATGYMNP